MKVFSPEHNILKYLAKWDQMKSDPAWIGDKYVQSVLTDGELDVAKLKLFLVDRGQCTGAEFDTFLPLYFDKGKVKKATVDKYTEMKLQHKADLAVADSKPTKAEKDAELLVIKDKEY